MSIATIIQVVVAIIAILSALAFVITYLRSSVRTNTVELYRQDNDALRARVSTLEKSDHLKDVEIATLKGTVLVLTDTVTQEKAIAHLLRMAIRFATREGISIE